MVPPKLNACLINKISLCDATGKGSQRHFVQVRRKFAVIPLLYNGSARIGLVAFCVRPLNSGVHSTSALLPRLHRLPLGSLEIALKCTRPRQRFWFMWARFYVREGKESRGKLQTKMSFS